MDAGLDGLRLLAGVFCAHVLLLLRFGHALGHARPQIVADRRVGLALDDGVARVVRRDRLQVVRGLAAKGIGKQLRGHVDVSDLGGVDVDGGGVDAGGQHHAVAVVDGAAARLDGQIRRALGLRLRGVVARHDDLQVHQAKEEDGREDGEDGQRPERPVAVEDGKLACNAGGSGRLMRAAAARRLARA